MIECMRNAACEHMTLDEQISFCEEKSKNIKLKAEPQTFVDIKNSLEKLKELRGKKMEKFLESVIERDFDRRISEVVKMLERKQLFGTISLIKDLKYYLDLATKEKTRTCNCQQNRNSRDNEPCCRCDSRQTNADRIRNMSDEELAEEAPCPYMKEGKPLFYTNEKEYCKELTSSKLSNAWKPIAWMPLPEPYKESEEYHGEINN